MEKNATARVIERPENGASGFVIDRTPGYRPRHAAPVGEQVHVRPPHFLGAGWVGIVYGHMMTDPGDQFCRITRVEVVDTCGFMNLRPGLLVDVADTDIKAA